MKRVLIMAGGTGGHVFPGLAVARELIGRGVAVSWLGTRQGIESRTVPAAGLSIDMDYIRVRGVRNKGLLGWLLLPFAMIVAMLQAFRVIRRRKPDVVLSFGGFVAGPGGLVAWLLHTPLVVHEANAVPGFTNKYLALFARQILTGFPSGFSALTHSHQVGNPVRQEIAALPAPEKRLANRNGRLRVLVVGGSQGARVFNEVVPAAVQHTPHVWRPEVRHQCGRGQVAATRAAYGDAGDVEVTEFINDMAAAYAWADVVIARAGAMTVAELAAGGCCAILVPFPRAVDDHQTANARFLSERGAACLLPQAEFTPTHVATVLQELNDNRSLILKMASAARGQAVPDAADAVANACEEAERA